jgi:DNA polymerase-3 subunit alpha
LEVPEDERERVAEVASRKYGHDYVQDRLWFAIMPRIAAVPYRVLWLLEEKEGRPFDLDKLSGVSRSRHDGDTFAKIRAGDTEGVFLLDRLDLRSRLPEFAPQAVEDLAAIIALETITIDQPGLLEEYLRDEGPTRFPKATREVAGRLLRDTRNLILFQEQVILLLSAFGGIELSDGYIFVREAAKRKQAVVEEYRGRFLAKASGKLGEEDAELLFDELAQASTYACCKSHRISDAITAFQAAYLKTHHPAEFHEVLEGIQANI